MEIISISDWSDFVQFLEATEHYKYEHQASGIMFRGQSNSTWKLDSTLKRIIEGDVTSEKKAKYYEFLAEHEFKSQRHLLMERVAFSKVTGDSSGLIDMQHYSCPTRLLDWSGSPYVALYFTVSENVDCDGVIYMWDTHHYDNNMTTIHPEYAKMKGDKIVKFKKFDCVIGILSTSKNERIVRQQGLFSVSNNILLSHCDLIEEPAKLTDNFSGLYKLQIASHLKMEFLARLKSMNLTASSLFSGGDGLGRSIRETLLIRKWAKE